MNKRSVLKAAVAMTVLAIATPALAQENADAIHRRVLVLDGHVDVLLPWTLPRYFAPGGGSRANLQQLTNGGVDAVVYSVAVGPGPSDAAGVRAARAEADAKLATIRSFAAANPDRVAIALRADDVERLHREGKIAILIGFQNARSIGDDLRQLDAFYAQGVRIFAFNHAGHNALADSSRPSAGEPTARHGGLSARGRQAVTRLNTLGALIDVSQLSGEATLQTVALSTRPVVATHSNVRALVDNTCNLSDEEIDAIAAAGGVIQVTPFNAYLRGVDESARAPISALRQRFGLSADFSSPNQDYGTLAPGPQQQFLDELQVLTPRASIIDYVNHIDYIVRRVGVEHVGIGTDFDHGAGIEGFNSESEAGNVTRELVSRGYDEAQIAAIWSGNFLRVLRAAEAGDRRR